VSGSDSPFERECASAYLVLEGAEALGVKFLFSLEAGYPPGLPADCVRDLEAAIAAHRVLITRLLLERAGINIPSDLIDRAHQERDTRG
jgi:hypothetical protein